MAAIVPAIAFAQVVPAGQAFTPPTQCPQGSEARGIPETKFTQPQADALISIVREGKRIVGYARNASGLFACARPDPTALSADPASVAADPAAVAANPASVATVGGGLVNTALIEAVVMGIALGSVGMQVAAVAGDTPTEQPLSP